MLPGVNIERLTHAGGRLELALDEHRNAGAGAADLGAHQLGVLQFARQEQIVDRTETDADADARFVDIANVLERRILRYLVSAFDQHIRRGEVDLLSPHRVDGDEADIDGAAGDRVERLAAASKVT